MKSEEQLVNEKAKEMLHPFYSPEHRGNVVLQYEAERAIEFASHVSCPKMNQLKLDLIEKDKEIESKNNEIEELLIQINLLERS
jgi:hypothetical protein